MKNYKYLKILALMLIISAAYFAGFYGADIKPGSSLTVSAQPGSSNDPLVSRSYLESRISALEAQISGLVTSIAAMDNFHNQVSMPSAQRELFSVIRAEPGMILIGGASTEIILRSGEASVISGPNGLANVTTGIDVMNGQSVQLNNLLIFPQDDGRGLLFHTVAYLMIKGDFEWGSP